MTKSIDLAYDCGQGNGKLVGPAGWVMLESYAARQHRAALSHTFADIPSQQARMLIRLESGQGFWVGRNAHAVGEPVEALDFDRYTGVPEQRALFYGILTAYMRKYQVGLDRVRLTIGVPLGLFATSQPDVVAAVAGWLVGRHGWEADGKRYEVTVTDARVKSQAAGALYAYMFDENGHIVREHKRALVMPRPDGGYDFVPVGILSVGFLTMEAMAVQYQRGEGGELELVRQERFTASRPVGTHRLLEVARPGPEWTLAELDQQLRDGLLDIRYALPIYQREVSNALQEAWGINGWRRFGVILLVGGGAVTLGRWLRDRFDGKGFLPQSDPATNERYRATDGGDLLPFLWIAEGLYREASRS